MAYLSPQMFSISCVWKAAYAHHCTTKAAHFLAFGTFKICSTSYFEYTISCQSKLLYCALELILLSNCTSLPVNHSLSIFLPFPASGSHYSTLYLDGTLSFHISENIWYVPEILHLT
jgi:hypothetical protein